MSYYEILTPDQMERVHAASLQLLETVGVDFRYAPALEVLAKGGAKVEGERVFFSPDLVATQIKKAPAEFTLHARNPENNVVIGGDHMVYVPGYGAPFVTDTEGGRREATLRDFINFAKLTGASAHQDMTSAIVVEATDVPQSTRHMEMLLANMHYSDKCFMGCALGEKGACDSVEMAKILFGPETDLYQNPCLVTIQSTLTPLAYDGRMLGAMMAYARLGQAQMIASLSIAGATGPATLAGTLALQNAEVLAGIVLAQLVREGAPVIFGGSSSNSDMRYGSLCIGSPENALNVVGTAQMARYYGLPSRSGGTLSDTKTADAQGAYESMMNLLMAQTAGINFVLHSAGIVESYNCMSYEKFIIDDEICGMVKRIKRGYAVDDDTLALDVAAAVGPGGHFLDQDHTFSHFRTEFYQPQLSSREGFDKWDASGASTATDRAKQQYREILETYQVPALPADTLKALKAYIEANQGAV